MFFHYESGSANKCSELCSRDDCNIPMQFTFCLQKIILTSVLQKLTLTKSVKSQK